MLSFDAGLTNALKNSNSTAFWVLKLYYNDESDFIGVSDRHRQDGTDIYYGLVASWGSYRQSLDFFNFTTSIGNMSLTLINADKSIQGKRFSDLLATNNFGNRKWELFLNTNETATLDTAARMIASGIISGDIKFDTNNVTFSLLDSSEKKHKQLPRTVIDATTYPNAPEKNIKINLFQSLTVTSLISPLHRLARFLQRRNSITFLLWANFRHLLRTRLIKTMAISMPREIVFQ